MTPAALSVLLQVSILAAAPDIQYAEAYQHSVATRRPLLVLVGADWCPACARMKSSVLPVLRNRGSLDRVAFATVNSDRQNSLAGKLMSGRSIPQLIMFVPRDDGWRREQLTGLQSAESVEAMIERGVNQSDGEPSRAVTAE